MTLSCYVSIVILGLALLYMLWFWGSCLYKYLYSYVQDGEKTVRDGCQIIYKLICKYDKEIKHDDHFFLGFVAPCVVSIIFISLFAVIIEVIGLTFSVYLITAVGTVWGILFAIRGLIRLNKKLDKHASDKEAHKN